MSYAFYLCTLTFNMNVYFYFSLCCWIEQKYAIIFWICSLEFNERAPFRNRTGNLTLSATKMLAWAMCRLFVRPYCPLPYDLGLFRIQYFVELILNIHGRAKGPCLINTRCKLHLPLVYYNGMMSQQSTVSKHNFCYIIVCPNLKTNPWIRLQWICMDQWELWLQDVNQVGTLSNGFKHTIWHLFFWALNGHLLSSNGHLIILFQGPRRQHIRICIPCT